MSEHTEISKALEPVMKKAGEKLLPHYGAVARVDVKDDETTVTQLDHEIEEFLAEELLEITPGAGVHGEEFGKQGSEDKFWLVDPIDGTEHFIRGMPFCTVMAAYVEGGQAVVGAIHDFVNDRYYSAVRGEGAFMNGEAIRVSDRPLRRAMIALEGKPDAMNGMYEALRGRTQLVNTMNSGFEHAMVASGKFDARIVKDGYGQVWDYAAGCLLVEEAGGMVVNIGSESYDYRQLDIIAGSRTACEEVLALEENVFKA